MKARKFLFLFFINLIFSTSILKAQWVQTFMQSGGVDGVYSFAVSGNNIFAGTGTNGVFLSTNNGVNWIPANTGLPQAQITSLVTNGNNIFAATSTGSSGYGVYISTNNGNTWSSVNTGLTSLGIQALGVRSEPNSIFAGTYWGGIFLSTNNGSNWQNISNGLSPNTIVFSFAFNGSNIFAGTSSGVYLSTNSGTSWTLCGNFHTRSLAIIGNKIFAGSGNGGGVFISTNNGTSWNSVNSGLLENYSVWSFATSGNNIFVCGGNDFSSSMHLSTNSGINWISTGFPIWTAYALTAPGDNIFAGTGLWVWRRPIDETIPPTILSPGSNTLSGFSIATQNPTFIWNGISSASSYRLQLYKKNNEVFELVNTFENIINNSAELPAGTLEDGSIYYWKISAHVNDSWTPYSSPLYFSISYSSLTPVVNLSTRSIQPNGTITISGNNFSKGGQVRICISSSNGYGANSTVTSDQSGNITSTATLTDPGNYSIYCQDNTTGSETSTKQFEVQSVTSNNLVITSPNSGYQLKSYQSLYVEWKDILSLGSVYPKVNSKRSYTYNIEKSTNNGSTWEIIATVSGLDYINKQIELKKDIVFTIPSTNYNIRVSDGYVSNRSTESVPIQVLASTETNLQVDFVWDNSYTNNVGNPIGVVCDGTSRFYIKVTDRLNKTISNVTLSLFDENGNNDKRVLGKLMKATANTSAYSKEANTADQISIDPITQSLGNNEFWCWYVAPDDFVASGTTSSDFKREVNVRIIAEYIDGTNDTIEKIIIIKRPPVVLVHGLNSDPSIWNNFLASNLFSRFNSYRISIGPKSGFDDNAKIILSSDLSSNNSIPGLINKFRDNKIACNQVYYVGHSMGGIVLRYAETNYRDVFFNQRNYEKGYINKFITLDTPHKGSAFANILNEKIDFFNKILTVSSIIDLAKYTVKNFLKNYYQFDIFSYITNVHDAIRDLQMNRVALNETSFKSHVIIGDIIAGQTSFSLIAKNDIGSLDISTSLKLALMSMYSNLLYGAMKEADADFIRLSGTSITNSDLIVPLDSQLSGLQINDTKVSSTVNFHSESTGTPSIENNSVSKVSSLLDESNSSNSWGYLPSTQVSNPRMLKKSSVQYIAADSSTIDILTPQSLDTLYIDSQFNLAFSLSDTTNLKKIQIFYQDKILEDTIKQTNYNYSLTVSNNLIDNQSILILAFFTSNDSTTISGKSVPVFIKSISNPLAIQTKQNLVYLLKDEEYSPEIDVYYENFIGQLGTNGTALNLTIDNTSVLTFDNTTKMVTALTEGETMAIATYNGLVDTLYFVVSGAPQPLPVELTSFAATIDGSSIILKWQTATEVNCYGFNLERQLSNGDWKNIGFIQGHGNSNSPKEYTYRDSPVGSKSYKYRLKQIDFDGSFEYSNAIIINLDVPSNFSIQQNYPNPFNPITTIAYSIPIKSKVELEIMDILGRKITSLVNEVKEPGNYEVKYHAQNLASGIYFYRIKAGNYIQTKKFILLK